ncbi:hypothetical protein HPB48_004960 [Haemaphysalis longicornis]|uniref:Fanconi Anaemia group E protein C-terminal domain-containing protein n=1 Tax=Haemaphysalis longicornis TaxID=44386 RepID=A0A9J6GEK2_HAELO|nr:hypothetical protein HPB48_004960 [Haemaphysalis longicornis]
MFTLYGRVYSDCKRDMLLELLEELKSKGTSEQPRSLETRATPQERCKPLFQFLPCDSEPEPIGDVLDDDTAELDEDPEEIVASNNRELCTHKMDELEVHGAPDDLADLPEEIQLSVARIKEALHSCDEGAVLTEDIRFMVAARPETVAAVCDELETDAIAHSKMFLLLASFAALKGEISLINGVVFVKSVLLPKVASWDENTRARPLVESIVAFAQDLPHVTIEGLVIPLISSEKLGKVQAEVVEMLIREGIPKDYTPVCLRHCTLLRTLQESKACIETLVMFIHSIIQKKGPLESVLTELCYRKTSQVTTKQKKEKNKRARSIFSGVTGFGERMRGLCAMMGASTGEWHRRGAMAPYACMICRLRRAT